MKKLLYSFAALLLAGGGVMAQEFSCLTDHYHRQMVEKDPSLAKDLQQLILNSQLQKSEGDDSTIFVIPVVFHILHENGVENLAASNIHEAIDILNVDFMKLNADTNLVFPPYAHMIANPRIQFKLATIDPQGNCTDGINRYFSHETNIGDEMAKINQWDRKKYLNIWVVKRILSGAAGYAVYPTGSNGPSYWRDGVVMLYDYVGSSAPSLPGRSRALTHEVGHWLALPHVWGSTNDPTIACGDDGIFDTPVTKGHNNCSTVESIVCDLTNFNQARYDFADLTTTSGPVDTTLTPNQINEAITRITFGPFTAAGVSTNSTRNGMFAFTDWGTGATDGETVAANLTGAIDTDKYYEFTLTPEELQGMTITKLTFDVGRNATGPRSFVIRTSNDNFSSNLNVTTANPTHLEVIGGNTYFLKNDSDTILPGVSLNISGASFTKRYAPITFRIFAYNAEDADGSFKVDNVLLNGTYGSFENVQNYMEYAYCQIMFTPGQKDVMRTALQGEDSFRQNLITPDNHAATGIDVAGPVVCIPKPAISANKKYVCIGQTVTFQDKSYNGVVTSREWTFQDGSPATSTAANPTVSFTSFGPKNVTLKVTNEAGEATEVFVGYIDVSETHAAYTGPKTFNFEDATQWQELRYNNVNDNYGKFAPTNLGFNSNGAVKLGLYKDLSNTLPGTQDSRYYQNLGGQIDEIITPTFDLRHTGGVTFSFDYSYASNAVISSDITEQITIFYSRDCSETWVPLGTSTTSVVGGAALISGGFAGGANYAPVSANDWKNKSSAFNVTALDNRTRFKIQFKSSDFSNNLYIDNIMIGGSLGIADDFSTEHELVVSPNPVVGGGNLNIQYTAGSEPVTFTLRNLQGEAISTVVRNEVNQAVAFGFEISENIAASYYFLEVTSAGASTVKKIAVIK